MYLDRPLVFSGTVVPDWQQQGHLPDPVDRVAVIVVEYMDYNLQEKIMELKGEEGDLKAVTPTDFDRAAQIIRETRKLIGEGLNSPAETGTEEDPEDETEEENEDETEDWEDGE